MTATQEHLLKLLLEIDEICKKHDITYFLEYGTMLGAVRHEGFIPWDADVDISMTEENYDKFVKACQTELDHKTRTFCDNRMNREFPTVYGHYVDMECCRMSGHTVFWDNLCGQTIDVFCLLELPGDPEKRERLIDRYYAYDEYCNSSFRHFRRKSESIMKYYREFQERGKKIGKENLLNELDKEFFGHHYEDCDTYMVASARGFEPTPFVPKKAYETWREVMFEGHPFKVAGDYVEMLTLYYGDNYNLFPKEPKLYVDMTHTGVCCQAYVDDFMCLMDKEQMMETRQTFKDIDVEEGYRAGVIQEQFYKVLELKIKKSLERKIREGNLDVAAMVERGTEKDLQKLDKLFTEYLDKQLNSGVIYWRVHFDIGDELEYAAMYTLFMARNNRRAIDRMFWLRKENHLPLTPKMLKMKDTMQHLRNIKKYMQYEDYEKAKESLDWGLLHFPDSKEVRLWEMRYLVKTAGNEEEYAKALELTEKLLLEYPKDMYCLKARADVFWETGRKEEAAAIYDTLKETSDDGMLLLDIRKREAAAVNRE